MTPSQHAEFKAITLPVIAWLNANCNPHTTVIVTPIGAELSEGVSAYTTEDYLRDNGTMTCTTIKGRGFTGWVCGPDMLVDLGKYGAPRIWVDGLTPNG